MTADKPELPNLPKTLRELLERQPPDRLDQMSIYADQLARWKRAERDHEVTETREHDSISEGEQTGLEERGIVRSILKQPNFRRSWNRLFLCQDLDADFTADTATSLSLSLAVSLI